MPFSKASTYSLISLSELKEKVEDIFGLLPTEQHLRSANGVITEHDQVLCNYNYFLLLCNYNYFLYQSGLGGLKPKASVHPERECGPCSRQN